MNYATIRTNLPDNPYRISMLLEVIYNLGQGKEK